MKDDKLSYKEKRLAALLKEALNILDKGSMFGINWTSTGKYYTKAYTYLEKIGYKEELKSQYTITKK